jgi:hypothetical protein
VRGGAVLSDGGSALDAFTAAVSRAKTIRCSTSAAAPSLPPPPTQEMDGAVIDGCDRRRGRRDFWTEEPGLGRACGDGALAARAADRRPCGCVCVYRLVTAFDTAPEEIDRFLAVAEGVENR